MIGRIYAGEKLLCEVENAEFQNGFVENRGRAIPNEVILAFETKINPRVLLFLCTGKYPSNNWLKMHGGIMERRIQVNRLRKNEWRKKKYDRSRNEEET